MCYIVCSAVSVSQESIVAIDAPAPRKKPLNVKRVLAKVVSAFKLRSKKAKAKSEVSESSASSSPVTVAAPLEDASVSEFVMVQREMPTSAFALTSVPTAIDVDAKSIAVGEVAKDVASSLRTIAASAPSCSSTVAMRPFAASPSLIPVRKTAARGEHELKSQNAIAVGREIPKAKETAKVGAAIGLKQRTANGIVNVPSATRMTNVIFKPTYPPISAIPIPIHPRGTRRLRVRARDPGHVRKVKTGPIGKNREVLGNRSNSPVPPNSARIGALCERKIHGEKDKEGNVDSYVDTKEAVNGPTEVITTDVSRQLREKADEELINNDSLAAASLGAQGMVSVTSSAAHGNYNIAQERQLHSYHFSALMSIASLPYINALTCAYTTSSSFGGEQITDIQVNVSTLPTIESLYDNEITSGFKQVQTCIGHHHSTSLNAERAMNVQDFNHNCASTKTSSEASRHVVKAAPYSGIPVVCKTGQDNEALNTANSGIRAVFSTHPITPIIAPHGCETNIAESDPQHIIETINLQRSAAQQPLVAHFTNPTSPQCAHAVLRSSTTTDVTDGGQVAQSSVPPIIGSRVSSDRADTSCTTNRDDEDSEVLSTMDQCVQKMQHAIGTFTRSASQAPVRMDHQKNVKPLCLHGHVEFLEQERQVQTHTTHTLSTVAELAPAAPTSIYSATTDSATSTGVLDDADNKHLARRLACERAHQAQARALIPMNKLDAMAVEERERCVGARTARNERRNSASANQNRTVQLRACSSSSSSPTTTTAPPPSRIPILKRVPAPRARTAELDTKTTPADLNRAKQCHLYYRAREQQIGARYTTTNLRGATAQHGLDFLLSQHSHYTSRLSYSFTTCLAALGNLHLGQYGIFQRHERNAGAYQT